MLIATGLQHKNMQMMYEIIYNALDEVSMEHTYKPEDYLNLFCLGMIFIFPSSHVDFLLE